MKKITFIMLFGLLFFNACNTGNFNKNIINNVKQRVKITTIQRKTIKNIIDFTTVVTYTKKNKITSPITGFIVKSNVVAGNSTLKNNILFSLETQEQSALSLANTTANSFNNTIINIKSPDNGFINVVYHQNGDFVQAGSPLCSFTNFSAVVFKTFIPYQYNQFIKLGTPCIIKFSDGTTLKGKFSQKINRLDSLSQSEIYYVKAPHKNKIPEGLNATILITLNTVKDAQTLPKSAILANETLNKFWVIKIINDSLAIKIPVKLGIALNDTIQIISPIFKNNDKIVIDGNYGLEDSTIVKIVKK